MIVRPAVPADAPGIARVHVESWRATYRGVVPHAHLDGLDVAARTERWADILARNETTTFVALDGDRIIGFASVGPARDWTGPHTGELWALYVDPSALGGGAGEALFRRGATELRVQGHHGMILWVLAQNPRARRFYEKHGGRVAAAKRDEVGGALLDEVAYAWDRLP